MAGEKEQKKEVNCIGFACLMKTSIGSINGGFSEGNVMTLKKITLPDGRTLPYVSGQAIRRMLRDRIAEMGERMSDLHLASDTGQKGKKSPDFTEGNPEKFIDDDLFGYLIAEQGQTRRRTAPVRVAPAVGLFPYAGDRDLGTKSKEKSTGDVEAGGSMFETEISYNVYRTNILVELDRVGVFQELELEKGKTGSIRSIDEKERKRRLKLLVTALGDLWGGGKQSRLLTDFGPMLIICTFQATKKPILLERMMMNENGELNLEPIKEALSEIKPKNENNVICGLATGFLPKKNEEEFRKLMKELNITVDTVSTAIEKVCKKIDDMKIPSQTINVAVKQA